MDIYTDRLLRLPSVMAVYGRKRSTLYLDISRGLFVKPVSLGPNSSAWPESEVAQIVAARIAGKTDDEIRDLVHSLEARRSGALDRFHEGAA